MAFICKFCNSQFKTLYTLKTHENGSKKCLEKRGLKLETNICVGCNLSFFNKYNLKLHEDVCRHFLQHQHAKEIIEKDKLLSDFKEEQEKRYIELAKENEQKLADLTHKNEQKLADLTHKNEQKLTDLTHKNEQKLVEFTQTNEKFLALLKEEHARQITDLKQQNDKLQENIQNLAREAINRPTTSSTTNNNTVNNIRNNLSTQYTLDDIKAEELMELFRENLTEKVFMSGQKGLAKLCTDKLINTKDAKKMICCTDVTRKKFKYMDKKGNVIEDIEAREFVNKVTKPIKEAGRQVYDTMMSTISDERDHVREDDYGKKDRLVTQSFQVMDRYKDIINIDDTKYNTEFTNELAILNKNSGTGTQDCK
jgi:hypothetical protein